jgi:hypothetical protein
LNYILTVGAVIAVGTLIAPEATILGGLYYLCGGENVNLGILDFLKKINPTQQQGELESVTIADVVDALMIQRLINMKIVRIENNTAIVNFGAL